MSSACTAQWLEWMSRYVSFDYTLYASRSYVLWNYLLKLSEIRIQKTWKVLFFTFSQCEFVRNNYVNCCKIMEVIASYRESYRRRVCIRIHLYLSTDSRLSLAIAIASWTVYHWNFCYYNAASYNNWESNTIYRRNVKVVYLVAHVAIHIAI